MEIRTQTDTISRDTVPPAPLIAGFASESEVAQALGVTASTLRTWASRRMGPGGRVRLGRTVLYRRDAVISWLSAKTSI